MPHETLAAPSPAPDRQSPKPRKPGYSARALFCALFVFLYAPFAYNFGWKFLPGGSADYPSYHCAAMLTFAEHKSPYGSAAFDFASQELGRKVHPYLYPPPSLLAFWPFSKLAFSPGKAALLVVSHLGYLTAIWLILSRLTLLPNEREKRVLTVVLSLLYFLLFDPAIVTLAVGQINLLVLPFLCLALVGMRQNFAPWRIALPLSVAILLKTYPVLLLLPLFFHRRFKAILLTCLFFAAFTALAALVLPSEVWGSWLREVLPQGGYANNAISPAGPWNQNINGFITRLFLPNEFSEAPLPSPAIARPVATLLALAVLGSTAFYSFRASRRNKSGVLGESEIASYLLMIFLIAPLSWEHHLVYVLPAAVLGIRMLVTHELSRRRAILVLSALFLIAWPVPLAEPALKHAWWTLLISIKFYAAVALWLFFVNQLRTASLLRPPDPAATHEVPAAPPASPLRATGAPHTN